MSKMFDALRRAEAERRRKNDGTEDAVPPAEMRRTETAVPVRPTHGDAVAQLPSVNGTEPFPGDFLRELGILRNSIESRFERGTKRVLVFSSPMHGEGVTTLALGYSRLLSLHGESRVLLVELNARRPSLATRFQLDRPEGVTDYFERNVPLAQLVQRPGGENFDVLHVGRADATMLQINIERLLPRLFEEALRTYDAVMVDAPPVVLYPETPPVAHLADGVVLVLHCGRTKRETAERSIKQIDQFKGRVVGVVLNRKRFYIPDFIYRRL